MLTNDRNAYRKVFFEAWQKHQQKLLLQTEEARLVEIMLEHPELHFVFEDEKTHMVQEYAMEENPFLHISLHMALRDQLRLDRPLGIKQVYEHLLSKYYHPIEVEHRMLPCLVSMLEQAQQSGTMPDDESYLTLLRKL